MFAGGMGSARPAACCLQNSWQRCCEVGKDFPPAPCFRLVPSSGPGPSPEARFSLGQSSQEQSCPAPGGCWWGFSPPGCPMQAFPQGKAG